MVAASGRLIGQSISTGERLVRRFVATPRVELIGGAVLSVSVIGASLASSRVLIRSTRRIRPQLGTIIEASLAWMALAMRSLDTEARAVVTALEADDLAAARTRLARIVGRDTAHLDEEEIARAVIETVAESTCDGVIAPLCYLAVGGVPLAFAYKAANTLDSMIGHKEHPYFYFGRVAARIDDVANYLPARLTAALFVLAASITGADAAGALRVWRRDGHKHASPNAGQSEAAMAGALRVRLGGLNYYNGEPHDAPYLSAEYERPNRSTTRHSLRLALTASLIGCAAAVAVCQWREHRKG